MNGKLDHHVDNGRFDFLKKGKGLIFLAAFAMILFGSCARMVRPRPSYYQTGIASWYGSDFNGKVTSNREIYDMYGMTAAHRDLPFQTLVKVTNLKNGISCIARINDRGPFVEGRIIDLSYFAAQTLDMVVDGVVPVKLHLLSDTEKLRAKQRYFVLVGSFRSLDNAKAQKKRLKGLYKTLEIGKITLDDQTFYRVKIIAATRKEAERKARQLRRKAFPVLVMEEFISL